MKMRLYKALRSVISAIPVAICCFLVAAEDTAVIQPITQLGTRPSPDGQFNVVLRQNSMGAGIDLFVMKQYEPIFYAADITGYLWINNLLIYSSLPLYGSGGIYKYNPMMETRSSVVDGKSNEYFELKSVSSKTKKLAYYHSDDIRHVDAARLKAPKEAVRGIAIPDTD
jgi:hypothetical protein